MSKDSKAEQRAEVLERGESFSTHTPSVRLPTPELQEARETKSPSRK